MIYVWLKVLKENIMEKIEMLMYGVTLLLNEKFYKTDLINYY